MPWGESKVLICRLGRRRSSASGSRRVSIEGSAPVASIPPQLARKPSIQSNFGSETELQSADSIRPSSPQKCSLQAPDPIPDVSPRKEAPANSDRSPTPEPSHRRNLSGHKQAVDPDQPITADAEPIIEQQDEVLEPKVVQPKGPRTSLALPKTRSMDTPRLGTPRRRADASLQNPAWDML